MRGIRQVLLAVLFCFLISDFHGVQASNDVTSEKKSFYEVLLDLLEFVYKTQMNQDQFNFDKYELNTNTTLISCKAFLSDIVISGFSSFDYKFVQLGKSFNTKVYNFSLTTSYNKLKLMADNYHLDLDILTMIPLYGEGRAGILLGNLTSVMNITLEEGKNGLISINALDMDLDIREFKTSLEGLLNTEAQSDLISSVLTFILPNVFEDIKPYLLMLLSPLLKYEANSYLTSSKLTLQQLIQLIESYVGPSS